jgi:hypothetical protein
MAKMKLPFYEIPMLHSGFYVFVGPNQRVKNFLESRLRVDSFEETCDDLDACGGMHICFTSPDGDQNLVWLPDLDNEFVVFHEALHCSFSILRRLGIPADPDSQEAIAYLQEEVVKGIRLVGSKFVYKDEPVVARGAGLAVGNGIIKRISKIARRLNP